MSDHPNFDDRARDLDDDHWFENPQPAGTAAASADDNAFQRALRDEMNAAADDARANLYRFGFLREPVDGSLGAIGELSEEALSRLLGDLFDIDDTGTRISRPIPILWQITLDEFHEMMGRSFVAQRIACIPTDMLSEAEVPDPEGGESTLMFNSQPMIALAISPNLVGQVDVIANISVDVALRFSDQLRKLALAMKAGS